MNRTNAMIGLISIILGIIVITFPVFGVFAASIIDGVALLFLSLWAMIHSLREWEYSKGVGASYLILGVIGLVISLIIIGNISAYSFFFGLTFYIIGFFILMMGILVLLGEIGTGRWLGLLGVLLGIFAIFLGFLSFDPINLAFIIGFWLILFGLAEILVIGEE